MALFFVCRLKECLYSCSHASLRYVCYCSFGNEVQDHVYVIDEIKCQTKSWFLFAIIWLPWPQTAINQQSCFNLLKIYLLFHVYIQCFHHANARSLSSAPLRSLRCSVYIKQGTTIKSHSHYASCARNARQVNKDAPLPC